MMAPALVRCSLFKQFGQIVEGLLFTARNFANEIFEMINDVFQVNFTFLQIPVATGHSPLKRKTHSFSLSELRFVGFLQLLLPFLSNFPPVNFDAFSGRRKRSPSGIKQKLIHVQQMIMSETKCNLNMIDQIRQQVKINRLKFKYLYNSKKIFTFIRAEKYKAIYFLAFFLYIFVLYIQITIISNMIQENEDKQVQEQRQQSPLAPCRQRYKSFLHIFMIIANTSLSSFYFGYIIMYMSVIRFEAITQIFGITMNKANAQGILTFFVPLGGLIGSFFSSYFINHISRRKSILYINYAAFLVGCFIFVPNAFMYMFLRLLQGICAGLYSSIVPLIIKEIAPPQLSGFFGVFQQLFITIGIFVSCFLSFVLSQIYHDPTGITYWQWIFVVPLLSLAGQTFSLHFLFAFQTPKYLIDHLRQSEAKQVVSKLYHTEFVDQILKSLHEQNQNQNSSSGKDMQIVTEPTVIQVEPRKDLRITKIIALHLSLLQQFVGISAVATYASEIAAGSLQSFRQILPSIINFEQVATCLISSSLLTKYGRKSILQGGVIGSVVTNLIIAIGFFINKSNPNASVVFILFGLFTFMANFGLSLGPIVWMYIPEIVLPNFLPFSTMMNWGGSAISILLFPIIKQSLPDKNPGVMFLFFSLWSLVSFFINKDYIVETKDKTSSNIFLEYKKLQDK